MRISKDVGSQRLNLAHRRSLSPTLLPCLSLPPSISISLIPKMKRFATLSSLAQCVSDGFILVGFPLLLDLHDKAVEREDERERENTEWVNKCGSLAAVGHQGGLSPPLTRNTWTRPLIETVRDVLWLFVCTCGQKRASSFSSPSYTVGNLTPLRSPTSFNSISNSEEQPPITC